MEKYTRLRERILTSRLADHCQLLLPPAATDEQLLRVHTSAYLRAVTTGDLSPLQQRRIGFPWSEEMVQRSRRSTGATVAAAQAAMEQGISANLAGGTHHAFADSGQGYCVFNDTCVAARTLQAEGKIQTALIIDCDVHQGNGTASIAQNDPTLFACSLHCEENYPFQKTNGDLDVALPRGTGDDVFLYELKASIVRIFLTFEPDIVFYLAGADPFQGDRLGRLQLTKNGLRRRDELVIDFCRDLDVPVAIAMAGGYAPDLEDIVDIHLATIETANARLRNETLAI